ncbi:MAG: hypothetical protein WAX70_06975, partial [Gemmiger qucibialis]|nr:hypothetical protein [Gemmiger sp.]
LRHGICVAKMLDNTQSIICAFGLAAAAPRSPYRHLELCGIALTKVYQKNQQFSRQDKTLPAAFALFFRCT